MISINNLSVEFSAHKLLDNISYVINPRDRIALVGKNGAGKSTMLKIIAGLQTPSSGNVAIPSGTTIGYLPQQMVLTDDVTVLEEARKAFAHLDQQQELLNKLNTELASRQDYESTEYEALISRIAQLTDQLAMTDPTAGIAQAEKTLLGLGFERSDFNRPTKEFSGGWRMRIELAKILLQNPEVLLLDEPTNHLDIESIQWLESFLATRSRAVVLVSHDRAFLDNVTNRTIEISLGKIYDYNVNYSKFVELRQERIQQQMRAYQNQQKQIADTQAFIERFRYKATKAVQVQSRMKQLAKLDIIEVDEVDNSRLSLKFPPAPRSGDYPVIADNVGKAYGEQQVFDHCTFTIKRGEKVAFVGKNGAGKSTLVKCIMSEIDHTGTLKIGHNVKIGYFAQNQAQMLDGELTVFDTIDQVAVGDIRLKIRDLLGAFMFGGEASDKKVKVLSGGEKTRLAMIKLLLEPVNLLILDEPTNHLDMRTKDILKQALMDFDGTLIVVSHDREFLEGLVNKVYEFGHGEVRECLGGIYEFLEKKKIDNLHQLETKSVPSKEDTQPKAAQKYANIDKETKTAKPPRLSYQEQKERDRALRKARKTVEDAESKVAECEAKVAEIEQQLSRPDGDGFAPDTLYTRHAQAVKDLENAMSVWELACGKFDKLEKRY